VRAEDAVEASLAAIEASASLGAWTRVLADQARGRARAVDAMVRAGADPGPLAGVPVGIKENLCMEGVPATCASRMMEGHRPLFTATTVARLVAAGAVVVGRCNQDEFSMGSSGETSAWGPALNPWDPTRTPGGSSSGSASAVASRAVPLALGSDTGGSIRQPAGFCGLVGLKPTWGGLSRHGLVAYASSLDQVGPLAHTVEDVARALAVMQGACRHDATCDPSPAAVRWPGDGEALGRLRGLRVGLPREFFGAGLEPGVVAVLDQVRARLEAEGAIPVPVSLPSIAHSVATYYLVACAEAASNLARVDGLHSGVCPGTEGATADALLRASRTLGLGREVRRRIVLGTHMLRAGWCDQWLQRAQRVRTLLIREAESAFEACDVLLSPTAAEVAFPLGERARDPVRMALGDLFTLMTNLAGLPALAMPAGLHPTLGLPVGLQWQGPPRSENRLLAVGRAWELLRGPLPPAPHAMPPKPWELP
jgi:aspartyl-tRNA(Asn)/glutamyl-tRNA(Gln) amidotransferase subunit A